MSLVRWIDLFGFDNFDNERFKKVLKKIPLDDYTKPWIFFLYSNPLPEKLEKIFNRQKTVSGKIGVLNKWLIKVAKKKEVSTELLKLYISTRENVYSDGSLYDRWIKDSEDRLANGLLDDYNIIKEHKRIQRWKTTKDRERILLMKVSKMLIKETIG